MRRLIQLARWFETFWWCKCSYSNIATLRCYHCGARPPRQLRAEVESIPMVGVPSVHRDTVDA